MTESCNALPCIRCGYCAQVCPVDLQPQFLHASIQAKDWEKVEALQLDACLFCHACTAICPSQIPLNEQFRSAHATVTEHKQKQEASQLAKQRFEAREARLLRQKNATTVAINDKQAAIQAALERTQRKLNLETSA